MRFAGLDDGHAHLDSAPAGAVSRIDRLLSEIHAARAATDAFLDERSGGTAREVAVARGPAATPAERLTVMKSFVRQILAASAVVLGASAALAQESVPNETTGFDRPVPAVSRALEIAVGGGYLQGVGDIAGIGPRVQDLSGPGGTVELKVGYRATPNLAFGGYGTYSQFAAGDDLLDGTDVRGATAGAFAEWHFRPSQSIDPWVGLASGWRGLWLSPDSGKNTSIQGWEIARVQLGLDYRISPEVAIGPVIGASVNTFFTEDSPAMTGFTNISDPHANFLFFAGLQARFDAFGHKELPGQAVQASAK
jgi:hypothetical protein